MACMLFCRHTCNRTCTNQVARASALPLPIAGANCEWVTAPLGFIMASPQPEHRRSLLNVGQLFRRPMPIPLMRTIAALRRYILGKIVSQCVGTALTTVPSAVNGSPLGACTVESDLSIVSRHDAP